jgi:hypothetical protein
MEDPINNYAVKTVLNLQPHQQRVVLEKQQLDLKIEALSSFIKLDNRLFSDLPIEECNRLTQQYEIMQQYSDILGQRIAAFE